MIRARNRFRLRGYYPLWRDGSSACAETLASCRPFQDRSPNEVSIFVCSHWIKSESSSYNPKPRTARKHQILSTKSQTISNDQNLKFKTFRFLKFRIWNLFGIWILRFGISVLGTVGLGCSQFARRYYGNCELCPKIRALSEEFLVTRSWPSTFLSAALTLIHVCKAKPPIS